LDDDVLGRWALTMRTPVGAIAAEVLLERDGAVLSGTATSTAETVRLRNIQVTSTQDGEQVTWEQSITKPMRLNLRFDVVVRDDAMDGHSRAGRLPRSSVTGRRMNPEQS
jgi:hypothetical protein